jgi:hypothetical protein
VRRATGTLPADPAQPPLLGTAGDLCGAFFHVERCEEAQIEAACLCGEGSALECARKSVACVSRLTAATPSSSAAAGPAAAGRAGTEDARPPLYVGRYTNCFQGASRLNVHAEQFAIQDERLLAALRSEEARGGTLSLFLTYQPCHHSSGHDRTRGDAEAHQTSCTRSLLAFRRTVLDRLPIHLDVVIANLYRAHWRVFDSEQERQLYAPRIAAAQAGLLLLAREPRMSVRVLEQPDWRFLCSLAQPSLFAQWLCAAAQAAQAGAEPASKAEEPAPEPARGSGSASGATQEPIGEKTGAAAAAADAARQPPEASAAPRATSDCGPVTGRRFHARREMDAFIRATLARLHDHVRAESSPARAPAPAAGVGDSIDAAAPAVAGSAALDAVGMTAEQLAAIFGTLALDPSGGKNGHQVLLCMPSRQ